MVSDPDPSSRRHHPGGATTAGLCYACHVVCCPWTVSPVVVIYHCVTFRFCRTQRWFETRTQITSVLALMCRSVGSIRVGSWPGLAPSSTPPTWTWIEVHLPPSPPTNYFLASIDVGDPTLGGPVSTRSPTAAPPSPPPTTAGPTRHPSSSPTARPTRRPSSMSPTAQPTTDLNDPECHDDCACTRRSEFEFTMLGASDDDDDDRLLLQLDRLPELPVSARPSRRQKRISL